MDAAEEAQRHGAELEIALPIGEQAGDRPAIVDIARGVAHHLGPERRAQRVAIAGLLAEGFGEIMRPVRHAVPVIVQWNSDS